MLASDHQGEVIMQNFEFKISPLAEELQKLLQSISIDNMQAKADLCLRGYMVDEREQAILLCSYNIIPTSALILPGLEEFREKLQRLKLPFHRLEEVPDRFEGKI